MPSFPVTGQEAVGDAEPRGPAPSPLLAPPPAGSLCRAAIQSVSLLKVPKSQACLWAEVEAKMRAGGGGGGM